MGEKAGLLEMFVFSLLMVNRRESGIRGQMTIKCTSFSVQQARHAEAFHVVCSNRTVPLLLLFAPDLISVIMAGIG